MKKTTLLILILVICIYSCKKGSDATGSVSAMPKTYTEDIRSSGFNSAVTYNLTYDGKNRLISLAATPEPSISKFLYQYPDDKTVVMDLYNNDHLSVHEKFWLNGFSLLDSTFQYNDSQDSSGEKYLYDPNHQLITVNNYDYAGGVPLLSDRTQYTYDNNGNALTQSEYSGTTSFTYYTDVPYTLSTGVNFILGPKYFFKTTSSNASGSLLIATHYYKFDGSNRLIQDSAYVSGADAIAIKSYTY